MRRDVVWWLFDVTVTSALLVTGVVLRIVWFWLAGFVWLVIALRQMRLARLTRRRVDQVDMRDQ